MVVGNFREPNVEAEAENLEYLLDLVDSLAVHDLEFVAVDFVVVVVVVDDDDAFAVGVVVAAVDDVDSSYSVFAAAIASVVLGSNVVDL